MLICLLFFHSWTRTDETCLRLVLLLLLLLLKLNVLFVFVLKTDYMDG